MRTTLIAVASLLAFSVLSVACGGGGEDDFSDIRASATAVATPNGGDDETATSTAATSTEDSGNGSDGDYIADVRAGYDQLKTDLKQLSDDMFAAQNAQSDPNTPIILRADMQAVNDSVAQLRELEAPDSLATFESDLAAALDEIENGTTHLETAITTQDQAEGAAAFAALTNGERMLDDAIELLPAS
jgi:hypothetical protein